MGTVEVLRTAAGTLGAAILRRRAEAERLELVREQSARVEAQTAQRRVAFLAAASQLLVASLDYETTLQDVADLLVPDLAECCFIDILEAAKAVFPTIQRQRAALGLTACLIGSILMKLGNTVPLRSPKGNSSSGR